uniref:GATA-type domain-containing protein n=1 Tax=Parascaris univalens TaxID=6257 RepID=A0A915BTU9_PARUN
MRGNAGAFTFTGVCAKASHHCDVEYQSPFLSYDSIEVIADLISYLRAAKEVDTHSHISCALWIIGKTKSGNFVLRIRINKSTYLSPSWLFS